MEKDPSCIQRIPPYPYKEPEYPSQQQPDKPPPIIVNDVKEFEVEEILDS